MFRNALSRGALVLAFALVPAAVHAENQNMMSDAAYIAKTTAAAPASVVKHATILRMTGKTSTRTIQQGTNGFTCLLMMPAIPMCGDRNAMLWAKAYIAKKRPPNVVGLIYMLSGDNGASNTDPYAMGPTANNHWVHTGPHVMIVGPSARNMGYPMSPNAGDPSAPYIMWPGTPYVHLMVPVSVHK